MQGQGSNVGVKHQIFVQGKCVEASVTYVYISSFFLQKLKLCLWGKKNSPILGVTN